MTFKTVLFDGTLADTNRLISESHFVVMEENFPGRFKKEEMAQFNGPSLEEIYGNLDQSRQQELVARYREVMLAKHDDMIGIFPGIKEMLENLKQEGLRLGVVSTKRSDVLKRGYRSLASRNILTRSSVPAIFRTRNLIRNRSSWPWSVWMLKEKPA